MGANSRDLQESLRMIPEDQFFDRKEEIRSLLDRIIRLPDFPVQTCLLTGPRRVGSSEIIKRVYRELFIGQEKILPFFYRFERTFQDPSSFVRDYLTTLIRQYIAFQDKKPSVLLPEVVAFQTVERIALDRSDPGLDRLLSEYQEHLNNPDREGLARFALHAPRMLAENSTGYTCMILDHLHLIYQMHWTSCAPLHELYPEVMGHEKAPHLFTGSGSLLIRNFLGQESMTGRVRCMHLSRMTSEKALETFMSLCERYQVPTGIEAVKKELHRFHGTPFYMASVIRRGGEEGVSFTTADAIRDLYLEEISRGGIALYFDSLLNRCFKDPFEKRDAIRILTHQPLLSGGKCSIEEVAREVSLDPLRVRELTESLIPAGLLEGDYGMLAGVQDPVLGDFLLSAQQVWMPGKAGKPISREAVKEFPDIPILTELKKKGEAEEGTEGERISFGLVLPMASETELVAARALEQVAERVDFPDEEIRKIRMALIEACINSFEHSGSKDGKIYITFTLDREKLTIVVEDKGVSFDPHAVPVPGPGKMADSLQRRGWGIELIRNLMDQVVFEDVPVGTRLKMIKLYPEEAGLKVEAG